MIAGAVPGSPGWYAAREAELKAAWEDFFEDLYDVEYIEVEYETPEGEY